MRTSLVLLAIVLAACSGTNSRSHADGRAADSSQNTATPTLKVDRIDLAGIERLIHNRNGKPLLLNFWATWCVPCQEEFPDLVKLAEARQKDAEIIGISLDYPREIDSKVIPFLKEHQINFTVYVADVTDQDLFITTLNPDWSGALPATFVFNAGGQQISMLVGQQTFAGFEKVLNQAL